MIFACTTPWLTPTPHFQAVALTLATDVALFPGDRQNADTADGRNGKEVGMKSILFLLRDAGAH